MASEKANNVETVGDFKDIPRGYINALRATHTYYDFQLVLGNATSNDKGDELIMVVEPRFLAQMAPQHFKIMVSVLVGQLEAYEKLFGTIPLPPPEMNPATPGAK